MSPITVRIAVNIFNTIVLTSSSLFAFACNECVFTDFIEILSFGPVVQIRIGTLNARTFLSLGKTVDARVTG